MATGRIVSYMETKMTFTTTPPTKPGFYAWRSCKGDDRDFTGTVWRGVDELWASVEGRVDIVSNFSGEWCRLVPAEEVEKAYREGAHHSLLLQAEIDYEWNHSRAKRVMEGEL